MRESFGAHVVIGNDAKAWHWERLGTEQESAYLIFGNGGFYWDWRWSDYEW